MAKLKNEDEIVYSLSNNEDSTVWRLEIGSKAQLSEAEFMLCLESYVADWFKEQTGSAFGSKGLAEH